MVKIPATFHKIDSLRERYYKISSGKESLLDIISETEIAEQVYNSNAIENSTLTLEETEKILLQIDLDRYISQREMFEAKNLASVVLYINKKAKTQELTLDSGFIGEGYIFPVGGIGIVPWIPRMNREGFGSSDSVGGFYTSIPDPLGSGLTFAVHEYFGGADNQNAAGETQDINVNVEISVDLAPLVAPMSTSNAAPVYKFGILS